MTTSSERTGGKGSFLRDVFSRVVTTIEMPGNESTILLDLFYTVLVAAVRGFETKETENGNSSSQNTRKTGTRELEEAFVLQATGKQPLGQSNDKHLWPIREKFFKIHKIDPSEYDIDFVFFLCFLTLS